MPVRVHSTRSSAVDVGAYDGTVIHAPPDVEHALVRSDTADEGCVPVVRAHVHGRAARAGELDRHRPARRQRHRHVRGRLTVLNAHGYAPTPGAVLTAATCGSCTGGFSTVRGPYTAAVNPTTLTVTALQTGPLDHLVAVAQHGERRAGRIAGFPGRGIRRLRARHRRRSGTTVFTVAVERAPSTRARPTPPETTPSPAPSRRLAPGDGDGDPPRRGRRARSHRREPGIDIGGRGYGAGLHGAAARTRSGTTSVTSSARDDVHHDARWRVCRGDVYCNDRRRPRGEGDPGHRPGNGRAHRGRPDHSRISPSAQPGHHRCRRHPGLHRARKPTPTGTISER